MTRFGNVFRQEKSSWAGVSYGLGTGNAIAAGTAGPTSDEISIYLGSKI